MVKTAEEKKEYQRLYYLKNRKKLDEKRKGPIERWHQRNENYYKEYYQKNKYKILKQVAGYKITNPNYNSEYAKNNKPIIRKIAAKASRNKRQGLFMAIDRFFTPEASEKILSSLCDYYLDSITKDDYHKWYNQKEHYIP